MSSKIDQQLFSAHEHALEHEPCPECGSELQLRHGKHGPFLGCSQYPSCSYVRPLHQNDGHIVKELGVACPKCANELVLRQGRYGMFIGCSSYPECHHIESLDKPEQLTEDKPLYGCPECGRGHLVERKSRFGKTFFATMFVIFISSFGTIFLFRFNPFLLGINVLAFYMTFTGYRVVYRKRGANGQNAQLIDWIAMILATIAGLFLIIWGALVMTGNTRIAWASTFGILGIAFGVFILFKLIPEWSSDDSIKTPSSA